jgi:hypothetical protein
VADVLPRLRLREQAEAGQRQRQPGSGAHLREWIQKPTNASTFACGFSRRSCQKNFPDCDCWSTTIWSETLHQSCSGTQDAAIARAKVMGLRAA